MNAYGGGTTINEGALQIHANSNLGAGGLTLAGGTLQLAADYVVTPVIVTEPTASLWPFSVKTAPLLPVDSTTIGGAS